VGATGEEEAAWSTTRVSAQARNGVGERGGLVCPPLLWAFPIHKGGDSGWETCGGETDPSIPGPTPMQLVDKKRKEPNCGMVEGRAGSDVGGGCKDASRALSIGGIRRYVCFSSDYKMYHKMRRDPPSLAVPILANQGCPIVSLRSTVVECTCRSKVGERLLQFAARRTIQ